MKELAVNDGKAYGFVRIDPEKEKVQFINIFDVNYLRELLDYSHDFNEKHVTLYILTRKSVPSIQMIGFIPGAIDEEKSIKDLFVVAPTFPEPKEPIDSERIINHLISRGFKPDITKSKLLKEIKETQSKLTELIKKFEDAL